MPTRLYLPVFLVSLIGLSLLVGCGSSDTMSDMNTTPAPTNANLTVNVGDAPADRVLALEMSITSVALRRSSGETVTLLSSPAHIEMTHLAGTMEPLVIQVIPQGTYTECIIGISAPEIMHVDSMTTQMMESQGTLTTQTVIVPLSPAITVGAAPMFLNLDFDVASSISIDAANNVTVTPTFRATSSPRVAEAEQRPENGRMEDVAGHVTSVNPPAFSVAVEHMTQSLTFTTDSSTIFKGAAGVAALSNHAMVEIEAVTRSDGSLLATKVEALTAQGSMMDDDMHAEGVIVRMSGAPVTEARLAMHNMMSPSTMMATSTNQLAVAITSSTRFGVDADHVDLSNLPFTPTFSRSTLALGQSIEVESESSMGSMDGMGAITATVVELERQSLTGTVSGYSGGTTQATFLLTLPSDSAFTALTGQSTITVYRQPGTELIGIAGIADGDQVRVRGLLFHDSGSYRLVAGRVSRP